MQNFNKTQLSLGFTFRTFTLFLALLFLNQSVSFGQCSPGASDCVNSPIIDFPFDTRMLSDINGSGEIPGCGGQGFFHNTTWYRIIPTTPFIFIDITSSNCSTVGGNQGVQMGFYPACDPNSQPVGSIQCECAAPGQTITLGGVVTPGVPYYIMIDGCSGSTCDLNMVLTTGAVQMPVVNLGTPAQPTTNDMIPTCPGAELTFTVPAVMDADIYTWNFPPGTTILSQDCNTVTVEWGPLGGDVSVSVTNTTNGQTNSGPPLNVPIDPPMYSLTREYCSPTPGGYVFYGDGQTYTEGFYNILVPGPICDTAVQLTVIENLIAVELVIELPTTCNAGNDGFDDGEATIFMQNNGASTYTYQWGNNAFTGPSNNQLPVGSTGVTITDNRGCSVETFVNITEPPYLSASVNVDIPPSCGSAADGEMVVFPQGGTSATGNYSYAWTGPNSYTSSMQNPTDIAAGVHELTITDDNGCEFLWIGNIVASGGNVTATESNLTGESCTGAANGGVTLTGDGTGTFTFTWPGDIEADTRNDLIAGDYEVTISNGSGCTGTQIVTIASGSSFTVDAPVVSDVSCFNDTDGSVTVNVMGGTAPISYALGSGTVTGNVISALAAGNYTLTVTDGAGCTSGDIPIVVGTPDEFLPTISNTPVTCGGSGNGTATVTPVGGTGPYTYEWGDGETTPDISNLSGGTYTVVVTDANMCSVPLSTEVDGGGSLVLTADPSTQLVVSCPGASDGSVTVNVSGATGAITYTWSGSTSTSATASGLAVGMYSVLVEDAAGCSNTFPVEITAPMAITVLEVDNVGTSCNGGMDGSAEVAVSGGTGTNYTFEWDNGEMTNPAVNLDEGAHTVIVRDENMCSQTFNVMIAEPAAITATIDPVDPECFGDSNGSITINAMGGSGSYSYNVVGATTGPQTGTNNQFALLDPDTYTITVSNMDGSCSETFTQTLTGQAEITAIVTPTDVSCAGEGDGEITAIPSGGVGPYTYLWTDGEVTQTITGKDGGGYFVTITDANMCEEVFPTSIAENTAITVSLDNQTDANCDGNGGGTAAVNVSGGDGNYTYTWSAGTPNDEQVSDLNPGAVTVIVEDNAGCQSMPFTITINSPDPVVIMEDQLNAETCFGEDDGMVTVTTSGGTGPFNFSIDGGATTQQDNEFTDLAPGSYDVDVEDANGCTSSVSINIAAATQITGSVDPASELTICNGTLDGSVTITAAGGDGNLMYRIDNGPQQANNVFDNLNGGSYDVEISDGNNCSIIVPVNITELAEVTVGVDLAASGLTICDGGVDGAVTITASGGDNDFQYTLVGQGPAQTDNEFTGLTGGSYTVEVMDGNGCTNDVDFTVTELAPIMIDLDGAASDLIVCTGSSDGTAMITASGGDNNLTYSIPGISTQNNGTFDNLAPDTYTVTVMDGNMCSNTFDFTVDPAPAITVQVDAAASDLNICDGDTDGSVTIDASGGDGNFMYTLGGVTQASPVFNNLPADDYTGMIEDGNGCSEPISVTVTAATAITASITASDLTVCNGFADGSVTITASGGDNNFMYDIGDGNGPQASNVFNNLASGPHSVQITDGSGCTTAPVDFTVTEGALINANVDAASDLLVCDGFTDGSITIMASGGTGSLMYDIIGDGNGPQASNEFTNLGEGDYTIMIIDADGCSPMDVPVTIAAAAPVTGGIDPVSNLSICNGETIGSVTINGSGGDGNLTYTLNPGPGEISQTTNVFNDLPAGNYTIAIEDGNGCTTTPLDFAVQEAPALTATVDPNSDLINCFGDSDGSVTINAAGGNGGFMYSIDNGATQQASNTFNDLAPGDYTIIITDANNCPSTPVDITVVEAAALDADLTLASSDLTVCSGVADGTAAIEATGGDGNYTYILDNDPASSQASNIFNNIAEGSHTVTVMDGNGCEQPVAFTVAPAPAITYTAAITNVGCFGQAEGQVAITMVAGDGPFTYAWSNGQATETAQLLVEGSYEVTITDANMCEEIETFNITEPVSALIIDDAAVVIQPATCGDTNGSVSISVSGGTAPYSYDWGNGSTTNPDLINAGPGSFVVTVTDANMCETISASYSVNEPGALGVNPNATPVACNGDSTGAISLDVVGGTAPYSFEWTDDDTETTADRTNLSQGTYTVIVSDADGCILPELNVNITQPEPLVITTLAPTQASCGASDGSVSLLVEGGTGIGTYTYAWSGGISSDPNLIDVPAGTYDVTVTDQNMCTVISEIATVTNPGTPDLAIAGTDVTCNGASNGSIMLDITGGSGGNTIDWGINSELNGLTNPTNLPAGDYFVTVTDMSMCESSTMITISEPAEPIVITEITVSQATCGNDNGSVTVSVSGGTGSYIYEWSGGSGTSATVIDLPSGNVDLTVTDQNMCTEVATYNVSEPGALEVDPTQTTVINANCNGTSTGSIDITVVGGTGPGTYTYAWADGFGTNEDLTNLPAGTYSLLITDQDDCTFNYTTTITEPEALTAIGTPIMANCGQSNGGINITVSGGTEPYDFAWNDPLLSTSEDLMNVPADNYSVTITDAQMCEFIFTDDVENPNPPMIGIATTDVTCNGTATGTALITATGGSGVYTYDWDDNTIDGPNPTNLSMGTYTVTVSDELSCSVVQTLTIDEPAPLTLTTEQVIPATCGNANGSVEIGITGGTLPYTYAWSNGETTQNLQSVVPGTYVLDFMDGNGCTLPGGSVSFEVSEPDALMATLVAVNQVDCPGGNNGSIEIVAQGGSGVYSYMWSNGETDEIIDNLTAGTYTLIVMDTDGCSFEYSETISQPDPIMITGTTVDAVCGESNGSISLTVTGGTGEYDFLWDNGADPVINPNNLAAGQYNVTVTDQNGCEAAPFDIAVTSPNAPQIEVASSPISCNGANDGSIDLTVTGGEGIVTLTWSDPSFEGPSVANLPPGVYTITAEDEAGCTFPVNVTIDEPLELEAFVIDPQSSTLCNGSADGSIDLNVQGGTGEYTYQWTNGAGNEQDPENLAAGIYDVIVTDDNGCTAFETAMIVEPDVIALTADPSPASCSNTADGGIEVNVVGGTGMYTYEWNGGEFTEEDLTALQPGNYTLVVSDQNNCNGTIDVVVPAPAPVTINLADVSDYNGFNTSCNESEDGSITVSAEGGNAGYSYAWADGTDGPTISQIGQGSYSVIVTDQEGCTGENNFSLTAPEPITLDVETDEPECFGESNGVIIVNGVEGGRLPYRYSLNNGDYTTAQFFGNLSSGTYSLLVEDANGCTTDSDVIVDEVNQVIVDLAEEAVINITLGDSITLSPETNIILTDSSYTWAIGYDGDTLQGLRPVVRPFNNTSYSISVTDEFGCTGSDEVLVQVTKPREIYIPNAFNPNSTNGNNLFTIHGGRDVEIVRSINIYNRWGEVVYADRNFPTDMPSRGSWDGFFRSKEAQSGVYIYIIEVDFIDGESKTYSGDVTLLR